MLEPSASEAKAVTPTLVPTTEFSSTASAAASVSEIAPTLNSSTSETLMVKPWVKKEPSSEVARTVTEWLVLLS